jgi:hypothetical protein
MVQKLIFPFVRKSFNAIRLSVEAQFAQLSFSVSGSQGFKALHPSFSTMTPYKFSAGALPLFSVESLHSRK